MTTITIKLPDAGAVRLIEESIKAGMAPDQFIAKLIQERLRQPSPDASGAKPDAAPQKKKAVAPPKLNPDGVKALQRIFGGFPGMPAPQGETGPVKASSKPRKQAKRPARKQ